MTRLTSIVAGIAMIACSVLGAAPDAGQSKADVFRVPEISLESTLTPEIFTDWIRQIEISPQGAKLTKRQLSALSNEMLRVDGICAAEGFSGTIPSGSSAFQSINATLEDEPGWSILQIRAREKGSVEAFAVIAFINHCVGSP